MEELQQCCNEKGEGDNPLKNWEKWLDIHSKQYAYLKTKVKRNSDCLLMNRFINEQRYINQEKRFIDKTKNYIKVLDHYRGHPNFWKFPISLKCPNQNLPPCYLTGQFDRTKSDPNPPLAEFVCTPDNILFEQGIGNSGSASIIKWKNSPTIKNKLAEIQSTTKTKMHRPCYNDLVIVGNKIHDYTDTGIYPSSRNSNKYNASNINEKHMPENYKMDNIKRNGKFENEDDLVGIKLKLIKPPEIKRSNLKNSFKQVSILSDENVQENMLMSVVYNEKSSIENNDPMINDQKAHLLWKNMKIKSMMGSMQDTETQVNLSYETSESTILKSSNNESAINEMNLHESDVECSHQIINLKQSIKSTTKPFHISEDYLPNTDELMIRNPPNSETSMKWLTKTSDATITKNKGIQVNLGDSLKSNSVNSGEGDEQRVSLYSVPGENQISICPASIVDNVQETNNINEQITRRNHMQQVNRSSLGSLTSEENNKFAFKLRYKFNLYDKETQVDFPSNFIRQDNIHKDTSVLIDQGAQTPIDSEDTVEIQSKISQFSEENQVFERFEITLLFGNCDVNHRYERTLEIENDSDVTVRYEWKIQPRLENKKIPLKMSKFIPRFYLNTNEGAIVPTGRVKIQINFKSKHPGVYTETWGFKTNPRTRNRYSLIHLEAFVLNHTENLEWECVEKYLENRVMNSYARNKLNEMLTKMKAETPMDFPYYNKFLEEEIFLHNNPDLFYESNSVQVLKDLNNKITLNNWDYSVPNLRKEILKVEPNLKRKYLETFSEHINNLLKPKKKTILCNKKYKTVYEILCSLANKIEQEGINLRKCLDINENVLLNSVVNFKYSDLENNNKKSMMKLTANKRSRKTIDSNQTTTEPEKQDKSSIQNIKIEPNLYSEILFIKTYEHLMMSIDEIAATLESISVLQKRSIFSCLGK